MKDITQRHFTYSLLWESVLTSGMLIGVYILSQYGDNIVPVKHYISENILEIDLILILNNWDLNEVFWNTDPNLFSSLNLSFKIIPFSIFYLPENRQLNLFVTIFYS